MKMTAILKLMVKGLMMSLMVLGVFAVAANAQKNDSKKFSYRLNKSKIKFATPVLDLSAGRIAVGGTLKGVEVSGRGGGCFTVTVTTYRLTPNGERVAVRSRSRQICKTERLPDVVIDRMPQGKYLVEIEIDRPPVGENSLAGEIEIRVLPERINLR